MDRCLESVFLGYIARGYENDQLTDIKVTPGDFLPEIGISRTVHHHIEISFLAFLDLTNRDSTMGKKPCHRRLLRNYVIIMSVKMMRIIKVLYQAASRARPFIRQSWVNPLSVPLCNTTVTTLYKIASNSQSIKYNISNINEISNCDCQVFLFISLAKEFARSRLRLKLISKLEFLSMAVIDMPFTFSFRIVWSISYDS